MPKPKWNLNTIYISERLQESLRPISRCAMTTVVAPMGYGKTTAVNWYLSERAKAETLRIIRISVYSDNLAIFWKSVQEVFSRAGFDVLRDYPCPTDAAGGGLLVDDLCHALAGEVPCCIFIDDFHLLTDKRASLFLCAVLPNITHPAFQKLLETAKSQLGATASLGTTISGTKDTDFESLLKAADAEMYENKKQYYIVTGKERRKHSL